MFIVALRTAHENADYYFGFVAVYFAVLYFHQFLNSFLWMYIFSKTRIAQFKSKYVIWRKSVFTALTIFGSVYAPIIVLPEGGNPGWTSGNPGECKIYMEQSLTFSRDLRKGKLNSPGPCLSTTFPPSWPGARTAVRGY